MIEDVFLLSEIGNIIPELFCYNPVQVKAGQTADFSGNFSSPWTESMSGSSHFNVFFLKNGEHVAFSNNNEADDSDVTNNSVSIIYREKVGVDSEF